MVGLKMRRKVEGWAVDVAETDAQVGRASLWQRLADNNRLWLCCLVVVLAVSGYLVKNVGRSVQDEPVQPAAKAPADYTDQAHKEFSRDFARSKSYGFRVIAAEFVAPDRFRVLVPANVSRDDVEYVARTAGESILAKFRFRAVIQVYRRGVNGVETLAATARWEPKKYGFVAKQPKAQMTSP